MESRYEAAQWQPEPEVRRGKGLVAALSWKLAGIGAIGVAAMGLVFLALGLAFGEWRNGDTPQPEVSDPPSNAQNEALMALAAEAEAEAQTFLVDARLHFVAYAESSGIYTFGFHRPGSSVLVTVVGPYTRDSSLPLWEVQQDVRATGSATPKVLDLGQLQHSLDEIMNAARVHYGYAGELMILLWPKAGGGVQWSALPAVTTSRSVPFECTGNQDIPASISCAVPTPTP